MSESYWGLISQEESVATPYSILLEQGKMLAKGTKDNLEGYLRRTENGTGFELTFYIQANKLNNYRYQLFRVKHDVHLYPLDVVFPSQPNLTCQGEEEFRNMLKEFLASASTMKIVHALLAQSRDDEGEMPF